MEGSGVYGQYIALRIPTDGYVSVHETDIVVDEKHAFSIETWIRLNGMGEGISILRKEGGFNFGVSHGRLYFRFGDLDVFQTSSQIKVNSGMWHHLVVASDKSFLYFYVNGECVGKIAVVLSIPDLPSGYDIGFNLDGYIRLLRVYDFCLSGSDVKEAMFSSATVSPCADFDFSCNPPIDRCHPSIPLELANGCRAYLLEPALYLQSTAYAEPSLSEDLNPGGRQIDAYTIQVSLLVQGNQDRQTIFVNGVHDIDAGMALYLRYEAEQGGYRLCSLRGADTNVGNKLFSSSIIPTDSWVNVAASYDGQSSRIYINGVLDAQEDNVGPILLPMTEGHLLIGGMLESGMSIGLNTMQGYIRRVDIWKRALAIDEIARYVGDPPAIDSDGLVDSFDFTNEPFRSSKLDIPLSMNDLARFKERATVLSVNMSEPAFSPRETVYADPKLLSLEREMLDVSLWERRIDSLCVREKLGTVENISRIVGRNITEHDLTRAKNLLAGINEGGHDGLLAVTHYMEGTDYVVVAHYRSGSEAIARCQVDEIDDCVLRLIELLFILIGGAIFALFGIKTKLSPQAINFIRLEILSLASVNAIVNKGEVLDGSDVYDLLHTLYANGKLKPLLRLIVNLGFWSLANFLAKAVLTFMGVGWADTIASLVATAAAFTLEFIEYLKHCIPRPQVTLVSITFNHDTTRSDVSALNLRKNRNTTVSRPEWNSGGLCCEPVAYAIRSMSSVRIKARFRMSYTLPCVITFRARAGLGNPLGDLGEVTATLFPGISRELSFSINNSSIANLKIGCNPNLQWNWEYKDSVSNEWKSIRSTIHKVFFLKDVPAFPWNQNAQDNHLWPWSDFLEISGGWLPANTIAPNASLAPWFTEGINASGLQYSGRRIYFCARDTRGRLTFNLTLFISEYQRGQNSAGVECSECASLLQLCSSLWGNGHLCIIYFSNDKGVVTSYLQAIGDGSWNQHAWMYHVIATDGNAATSPVDQVYDACIHLDGSYDPWNILPDPVPILPGGNANPMSLGQLTQMTMVPPYLNITEYLDRLFDHNVENRGNITFSELIINNIE